MENLNKNNIKIPDITNMSYINIKSYLDNLKQNYIAFNEKEDTLISTANILKKDNRKGVQELAFKVYKLVESRNREIMRVKSMYDFDRKYLKSHYIAGVDEVGRGPLAGPIVAASVILNLNSLNDRDLILGIKDSKKLSSKTREELSLIIKDKSVSYNIALLDNECIDSNGISWCNNMVFKMAVSGLDTSPDLVISDGYKIRDFNLKNDFVIKGDEKSASIACASIIAKVYRDNLMAEYAKVYPQYGFEMNAGYGTKEHIDAIKKYGICKIHRRCFLNNIIPNIESK